MRLLRRLALTAALLGLAWAGLGLGLVMALPVGTPVAILGDPAQSFDSIIAAGGLPVSAGPLAVIAVGQDPDFIRHLLQGGRLFVVPVGAAGCIALP